MFLDRGGGGIHDGEANGVGSVFGHSVRSGVRRLPRGLRGEWVDR